MRRRRREKCPVAIAIMLIVVGVIMGTIFVFGTKYWGKEIQRKDAVAVSAEYESYKLNYGFMRKRRELNQIVLNFNGYNTLYIDGACASEEVLEEIKTLSKGAKLDMLVHPNSDTVWELKHHGNTILSFENAKKNITMENKGFIFLGMFMYFCALYGFVSLLMRWVEARNK